MDRYVNRNVVVYVKHVNQSDQGCYEGNLDIS